MYIIASYIHLYPRQWMNSSKVCCVGFIISCAISVSSVFIFLKVWNSPYAFVMDSNTFLAVITAIFAFLFFKSIKVPYNKIINTVAASTFGVLCIHAIAVRCVSGYGRM